MTLLSSRPFMFPGFDTGLKCLGFALTLTRVREKGAAGYRHTSEAARLNAPASISPLTRVRGEEACRSGAAGLISPGFK